MASALVGIDGVTVTEVDREPGGRVTVWARVAGPAACPECGTAAEHAHEYVVTRPRDVRAGGQEVEFCLVKRRMECAERSCPKATFTESVPQVPPRCKITRRLLEQAGTEIADRGITP